MLAIIDYGLGNLRSVWNAFRYLGAEVEIVQDPRHLRRAQTFVLPGVGAFADGISNLRERGFVEVLEDEVRGQGKPLLGICLGMQILATLGLEHGRNHGLGWIEGVVERLPIPPGEPNLRIPHIGWNEVHFQRQGGLFAGLGTSACFYFVHSFALRPVDPTTVSGLCQHGTEFVAAIESGNIWATQFHPEKSHQVGLTVLRNFLEREGASPC